MIDKQRLIEKGARYQMDLTSCAPQLELYAKLLVDYNEKVNLTAITDPEGIEDRHFIDSLLLAHQPEVAGSLVDVGTGAGFPGVVAKLYKPELSLSLMEPTGKRLDFLRFLCKELGIQAEFIKERGEEAARKEWREKFDVATARAVAGLPVLLEYCLPLVRVGGVFAAMKGSADEEPAGRSACEKLGGVFLEKRQYFLPQGEERNLLFYKKISQTSPVYPRNGGKIAKKPL